MRFPHFFIERPIFAAVLFDPDRNHCAVAYPTLPTAQYPEVAPPTVVVTAAYPGATAETMADTVAVPLEQAINGVENMIYMSSSSLGDGTHDYYRQLQAGREYRSGAGARAEPRVGGGASSAAGCADDWRYGS